MQIYEVADRCTSQYTLIAFMGTLGISGLKSHRLPVKEF